MTESKTDGTRKVQQLVLCETMLCGKPAEFRRESKISRDKSHEYKCKTCMVRGYSPKSDFEEFTQNHRIT